MSEEKVKIHTTFKASQHEIAALLSVSPTCCASFTDNSACHANSPKSERQIIADAQRERLNHGLRTLASWCGSRAMLEHDTETTLTMLEKKAAGLRGKVMKAGWRAVSEHSQHNTKYQPTIQFGNSTLDIRNSNES